MKILDSKNVRKFQEIPNVGPRVEGDFKKLGIRFPKDLAKQKPFTMYKKLCEITSSRQDPCVLDVFISVVDFMKGNPPKPWWFYTKERKLRFPNI